MVVMYVRFPLSLRNVEDLLFRARHHICHETVRLWWKQVWPLWLPVQAVDSLDPLGGADHALLIDHIHAPLS